MSKKCSCPFCGFEITAENILFKYVETPQYEDERKYSYLRLCDTSWNASREKMYEGVYFHMEDAEENGVIQDRVSGLPKALRVNPANGKTPRMLQEEDEKYKLKNYMRSFRNKQQATKSTRSTAKPIGGAASFMSGFGLSTGSAAGKNVQDEVTEELPYDDGTIVSVGTRVCPNCHIELHQKFGTIETINVALMGGPGSGKTAYLVALAQQINIQLTARNQGTAVLLPSSQSYFDYLYSSCSTDGTTRATNKGQRLFPFVYYYTNNHQKECFICFYDIAGEDTTNVDQLLNHRGINDASVLLIMLDPNQLCDGTYFTAMNEMNGVTEPDENVNTSFKEPITTYLTKSIAANIDMNILQNTRLVISVMTKMDMPLHVDRELFAGDCIIKTDIGNAHREKLDLNVINSVQNELDRFLQKRMGLRTSFNRCVAGLFPPDRRDKMNFYLLGVSTQSLTDPGTLTFKNDWSDNAPKHRILEPTLLMLGWFGLIPHT